MTMDAKTLCLGVLTRGDASGYEIRKQYEEGPFAHFYDVGFGSIYPALRRLTEEELVTVTDSPPDGRPEKKIYRITPKGRRAFYEALMEPPAPDRVRSDFTFIMFFAHLLPARHLETIINARIAWLRQTIDRMERICSEPLQPGPRFARGLGLAIYRAMADYLEANRDELIQAAARNEQAAE